jgi:cephalosporin hydroxylase
MLAHVPHPWLVVEDSAHTHRTASAVLNYFDQLMRVGDRIVVEDGVVADLEGDHYRLFDDGPNRAVAEFLAKAPSRYSIDVKTCHFYGRNVN